MVLMPLPPLPQNPIPQQGSPGQIQNPPPGTQFKPQPAADIAQGLSGIVQGLWQGKQMRESHFDQQADQMIQQKMLGLPVDDSKMLKAMQRSSKYKNLQYEPPELGTQGQSSTQPAQQQQSPPGSAPGMGPSQMPPGGGAPQTAPPAGAPQGSVNPSLWSRVKQNAFGMGYPQPSQQSPAGQFVSQLGQAGQAGGGLIGALTRKGELSKLVDEGAKQGLDFETMSMENKVKIIGLTKSALGGDPKAKEMMATMLKGWELPGDDVRRFVRMASPDMPPAEADAAAANLMLNTMRGVPQMAVETAKIAKDLVERTGDLKSAQTAAQQLMSGQPVTVPIKATPEENAKNIESISKIMEQYPQAPMWAAQAVAMKDIVPGAKSIADQIESNPAILGPRKGTLAEKEWKARLGYDYSALASRMWVENEQLNNEKWKAVQKELGDEAAPFYTIMNNPDKYGGIDSDQYKEAAMAAASIATQKSTFKLNYKGQEISVLPEQVLQKGVSWGPNNILRLPPAKPGDIKGYVGTMQSLSQKSPQERKALYKGINPDNDPALNKQLEQLESIFSKNQPGVP